MLPYVMDCSIAPPEFDPADFVPRPLQEKKWPVNSIALDVSGKCNLACRYCAEAATQPLNRPGMEEEILDKALSMLSGSGALTQFQSIRLGSGEPLLAVQLLRHLEEKLQAMAGAGLPVPQVFLTTNGTRLDQETRDWLVQTGWNIKISLDGPAEIQNYWRSTLTGAPTYDLVADAVTDLSRRIPERFSVTAVLCRGSNPSAVYSSIADLGVRRIEFVPVAHFNTSMWPDADDQARYVNFVMEYADDYIRNGKVEVQLVRIINACRRVMGYDLKQVSCGAGRNFIAVDSKGDLFPCFRFIGMNEFGLGNLDHSLDSELLDDFQKRSGREYPLRSSCMKCWAAPLCGGPCFAEAETFGPGDGEPFGLHCFYTRADSTSAVRLVDGLRQKDPELLLDLLDGLVEF